MHKEVLANITRIENGFAFKSTEYANTGARIIRIGNVQKGEITDANPQFYPTNKLSDLEDYKLQENDLLMSLTGNVGRVGRIPKEMLPAYLNQRVCRITSITDKLADNYLYHFLNSDNFEKKAIKSARGVAQLNLSTKWLEQQQIPLPPLAEQKRIADLLDKADALRKKNQELLAAYDELLKATFLELFGDPVTNPKCFPIGEIEDLVSTVNYGTSSKAEENGKYPYLRMNNITYTGEMDFSDLKYINLSEREKDKYLVRKGDLLFNRTNSKDLVGKTAVYRNPQEMAIAGYIIRIRANEKANTDYISGFLNSIYGKKVLKGLCKSIVGMANINAKELQRIKILIPPISVQNQFAQIVENIEVQKTLVKQSLQESEDLFNALVQKAFNGELA